MKLSLSEQLLREAEWFILPVTLANVDYLVAWNNSSEGKNVYLHMRDTFKPMSNTQPNTFDHWVYLALLEAEFQKDIEGEQESKEHQLEQNQFH